jgi:hypothetical protein
MKQTIVSPTSVPEPCLTRPTWFWNKNTGHTEKSSRRQIASFKVTAKSYNVATAEPRQVMTVQNSQRSKASNAVLLTLSRAARGGEVLPLPWSMQFGDGYHSIPVYNSFVNCMLLITRKYFTKCNSVHHRYWTGIHVPSESTWSHVKGYVTNISYTVTHTSKALAKKKCWQFEISGVLKR